MTAELTPLDFSFHIGRLCRDIVARLPELAHVDMDRVMLNCCQTRKPVKHGMLASLTPLRFEGGATSTVRRGRTWNIERLAVGPGPDMLYVLSFYLPRFTNYPFAEKLATVIHELWHISPSFDGDLRRHPGRCYAHTGSQKKYDEAMQQLASRWLSLSPPPELYEFLRFSFRELQFRHGRVIGSKVRIPRLVPATLEQPALGR